MPSNTVYSQLFESRVPATNRENSIRSEIIGLFSYLHEETGKLKGSRELALVKTKLQEAELWFEMHVAVNGVDHE